MEKKEPRERNESPRRIRGLMLMTRMISNQFRYERAQRERAPGNGHAGTEREARKEPFKPLYLTSSQAFSKFQVRFHSAGTSALAH